MANEIQLLFVPSPNAEASASVEVGSAFYKPPPEGGGGGIGINSIAFMEYLEALEPGAPVAIAVEEITDEVLRDARGVAATRDRHVVVLYKSS